MSGLAGEHCIFLLSLAVMSAFFNAQLKYNCRFLWFIVDDKKFPDIRHIIRSLASILRGQQYPLIGRGLKLQNEYVVDDHR